MLTLLRLFDLICTSYTSIHFLDTSHFNMANIGQPLRASGPPGVWWNLMGPLTCQPQMIRVWGCQGKQRQCDAENSAAEWLLQSSARPSCGSFLGQPEATTIHSQVTLRIDFGINGTSESYR